MGIVLEADHRKAMVLTDDGRLVVVPNTKASVGQSISVDRSLLKSRTRFTAITQCAAVVVGFMLLGTGALIIHDGGAGRFDLKAQNETKIANETELAADTVILDDEPTPLGAVDSQGIDTGALAIVAVTAAAAAAAVTCIILKERKHQVNDRDEP